MKNRFYRNIFILLLLTLPIPQLPAQSIPLWEEDFGIPSANTPIQNYAGWQNQTLFYEGDGTCDIRSSNASRDYAEASGGGNVMLNNPTKWFSVAGINTEGRDSLKLHFGIRKGSSNEDGSNLRILYSTDGEAWDSLPPIQALPTGSGTTGWYYATLPSLPAVPNLRLKFSNRSSQEIRLDDLSITAYSTDPQPSIQIHSPIHGNSYSERVYFNVEVVDFALGLEGALWLGLQGPGTDTSLLLHTAEELDILAVTPLDLSPGNYQLMAILMDMEGNPLYPEVSVTTSFSIVLPQVGTPEISPTGGVYFEAQTVEILCGTDGASIHYTLDGSTPDNNSIPYLGSFSISTSCTVKAIAFKSGMADSEVNTARFVMQDTSASVTLPFDISDNSEMDKEDITLIPGIYGENMGSSYADGSAKFEQTHAGSAQLRLRMDSSPDSLVFDLRGRNGGASPQSYEGVLLEVMESPDNERWELLATLTEREISPVQYTRFTLRLAPETRYVKWFLSQADKGNTQLNNIKISKYQPPIVDTTETGDDDTTAILHFQAEMVKIYPNPVQNELCIDAGGTILREICLINMQGKLLFRQIGGTSSCQLSLQNYPQGFYFLKIDTEQGIFTWKIMKSAPMGSCGF